MSKEEEKEEKERRRKRHLNYFGMTKQGKSGLIITYQNEQQPFILQKKISVHLQLVFLSDFNFSVDSLYLL